MVNKHARSDQEISPKPKPVTSARARLQTVFGDPLLLQGEDPAVYGHLLDQFRAAIKPADIIAEMFLADVVFSEWEVLRWRRLKQSMIVKRAFETLEKFLREELDYDLYRDYFVDDLAEILEDNLPQDEVRSARTLAQQCAQNEQAAVDKVKKILDRVGLYIGRLIDAARDRRVKELVKEYAQHESKTIKLIDELLSSPGKSIDILLAEAVHYELDYIERLDRLTMIAEGRRNASLREIDRRRPILAETLRQTVQQIEHDELQVIEATPRRRIVS